MMPIILTYLVKVEREIAGDGAIETRLEERRPPVTETVRSTSVVFTDSRHARVDGLRTRKLRKSPHRKRKMGKNFISLPSRKNCVMGEKGRASEEIQFQPLRTFPNSAKRWHKERAEQSARDAMICKIHVLRG